VSRQTSRRARLVAVAAIVSIGYLSSPARGDDDWDVDLRAGLYVDDVEGVFVGGGGLTQIGDTRWFFNPNGEAAFGDELDLITLNGDVHYDFHVDDPKIAVWVGGGPAILFPDPVDAGEDDDVDVGLDGLFGVGATRGGVRPFGQIKIILSDETELVVMGGVRF
jgi:hypothetical protein